MNHPSAFSSTLFSLLLLLLLPICASPATKDACKQTQHDLDRQIDNLKLQQKQDLQACYTVSGKRSEQCLILKDQQVDELDNLRDERAFQVASCHRNPTFATTFLAGSDNDFFANHYQSLGHCVDNPYNNCAQSYYVHRHHHHHHHYSEGHGKSVSAGVGKSASDGAHVKAGQASKQNVAGTRGSGHAVPAQPEHRGSDRSEPSNHGSNRADSSSSASSNHHRDNSGGSSSGSSYSGSSYSGGSRSDSGSSYSGSSHSSGGSSSGSSSGGSSYSGSSSSGGSGASGASGASHDTGASRPK